MKTATVAPPAGPRAASPALRRLARTRAALVAVAVLRALATGAAMWATGRALALLAGTLGTPSAAALRVAHAALVTGALVVAAAMLARALRRATPLDAALWVERRTPPLAYALVTLADAQGALAESTRAELERRVVAAQWDAQLRRHAWRRLRLPAALLVLGLLAAALVPAATRGIAAVRGDMDTGTASAPGVAATAPGIRVRVVAPSYARRPTVTVDDPARVEALPGSTVEVSGTGRAREIAAHLAGADVAVRSVGGGWRIPLRMTSEPSVLRISRGGATRLLSLEPRPDSLPVVALRLPARDTVMRAAVGQLPLEAEARDDIGLARGAFEYIVSSGEGESFTFRSGVVGARDLAGDRRGSLRGALDLAALELKGGDIVHLRAIAHDARPGAGPGASETRTLRIPREGEYDSVSVEAAPPPEADRSLLSQRMLIRLAESLVARAPRLERAAVVAESRRIGADQARLRRSVGDIVFSRLGDEGGAEHSHSAGDGHGHTPGELSAMSNADAVLRAADSATGRGVAGALDFEGDETPVVAINRPLLEAYNAMWEATQSLDIGEPAAALPPMRRALDAIQRARAAERVYLRGRPPTVVVDLARVRLTGTDRGSAPAARAARPSATAATIARAARMTRALALLATDAGAATDSLLLLRVDALADAPALARALADATDQLRAGRDATAALVRARRLAAGGIGARDAGGAWAGAWSDAAAARAAPAGRP